MLKQTTVLFVLLLTLSNTSHATLIIEFNAENGTTPQDVGFVTMNSFTTGSFADVTSSFNIPQLGNKVWEVTANAQTGGYIFDTSSIFDFNKQATFSAYIRPLQDTPDNLNGIGNIEINRPSGSMPGIPTGFKMSFNNWYYIEISKEANSNVFTRSASIVDTNTGALTLLAQDADILASFGGSPFSSTYPDSIAFYMKNVGSTFIRTQFDNVTLSSVPVPPTIWLLSSALIGILGFKKRSHL